jgi:hypothetical protein
MYETQTVIVKNINAIAADIQYDLDCTDQKYTIELAVL